jgi:hypothetical protein
LSDSCSLYTRDLPASTQTCGLRCLEQESIGISHTSCPVLFFPRMAQRTFPFRSHPWNCPREDTPVRSIARVIVTYSIKYHLYSLSCGFVPHGEARKPPRTWFPLPAGFS